MIFGNPKSKSSQKKSDVTEVLLFFLASWIVMYYVRASPPEIFDKRKKAGSKPASRQQDKSWNFLIIYQCQRLMQGPCRNWPNFPMS